MHIQQQQHPLSPHTAVIEIVTYDGDGDLGLDHFAARLKLVFSDVDMPNHPGAMQTKQAQQIVDFLNSFEDIDTIITSCEAGMSRSPAIAAAIMVALGEDDQVIWSNTAYAPNAFCYRMVLKAFGKDDSAVEDKAATNLATWNARLKPNEMSHLHPEDIFYGIVSIIVDLHTHTIASVHAYSTLRENIEAAKREELYIIATTDHSLKGSYSEPLKS